MQHLLEITEHHSLANQLLFSPSKIPSYTANYTNPSRKLIFIPPSKNDEDKTLECIPCMFHHSPQSSTIVVHFHGTGGDIEKSSIWWRMLEHHANDPAVHVNVLAVEFPGYGVFGGTPSATSVTRVALRVMEFLVDEVGVPPSQIIVCGRSMGSGPASVVAERYSSLGLGGLILLSGYSALRDVLRHRLPAGGALAYLFIDRFNNAERLRSLTIATSVLIVHGAKDPVIHLSEAHKLLRSCPAGVQTNLVVDDEGTHDALRMVEPITEFLAAFHRRHQQRRVEWQLPAICQDVAHAQARTRDVSKVRERQRYYVRWMTYAACLSLLLRNDKLLALQLFVLLRSVAPSSRSFLVAQLPAKKRVAMCIGFCLIIWPVLSSTFADVPQTVVGTVAALLVIR